MGVSFPVCISGCRCIFLCTGQNFDAHTWLKTKMLDEDKDEDKDVRGNEIF